MTIPHDELQKWLIDNLKGQGLSFFIEDEQSIEDIITLLNSLKL